MLQNSKEVPGIVARAYRTNRSSGQARIKMLYPYPGYLWHGRTELTEVPGTGVNAVQNLQKFRVHGYKCPAELTEVLCRVIPRVNTPGMVLYVPYRTQPWITRFFACFTLMSPVKPEIRIVRTKKKKLRKKVCFYAYHSQSILVQL